MSLDRIHDVNGLMQFSAQPVIGTTGTASSVGSNQYPGGYQLGNVFGVMAGSNSTNGGALVVSPVPRGFATSDVQAPTSTGTITHDNGPIVLFNATAGGAYKLMPAQSHGQMLIMMNMSSGTGSLISTAAVSGLNATTTAACPVVDAAYTFAGSGALHFMGLAQRGGTATSNVPYVWCLIASK